MGILDAKNRLTVFAYDEFGRQTLKYQPFAPANPGDIDTAAEVYGAVPVNQLYEEREYDEFGRLLWSMDYEGQVTGFYYNERGQLWLKGYYDTFGDYNSGTPAETVEYTYDNLGRRKKVEKDDGVSTRTTEYDYDAEGRLVEVDSPEGVINYEYDPITGRKTRTYTGDGKLITDYTYDNLGRLQTVEDDKTSQNNTYGYNAVGSRQSIQHNHDNAQPQTNYGAYTYYDYDNLNRLTNLTNYTTSAMTTPLSSFAYTLYADGMRSSITEEVEQSTGSTEERIVTYSYDSLNRVTQEHAEETTPSDGDDYGYTIDYTYDLVGNRTERIVNTTNGDELITTYTYNDLDQLITEYHDGPEEGVSMRQGSDTFYAYATQDGIRYKHAGSKESIGGFTAFMMGLPTKASRPILIALWVLLAIVALAPVLIQALSRLRRKEPQGRRLRYTLFTRCLCLLLAFLFVLGPNEFNMIANADVLYHELETVNWHSGNRTITYTYDNNGSLKQKVTCTGAPDDPDPEEKEYIVYEYNLQGRLARQTVSASGSDTVTDYVYNNAGIRVRKIDDPGLASEKTTHYLVDSANPTGYAQVLVEETWETDDPDPTNWTIESLRAYTLGDDVIAQSDNPGILADTRYLLYDGHGSTRQVTDAAIDDNMDIRDSYSYDTYGMMLGGNPTKDTPAATNLLYTGEQFDTNSQQYYLRARYYDPSNGRFNRLDPYAGNMQDPQSLHKYLYCHANPVNGIDPSGLFLASVVSALSIVWCTAKLLALRTFNAARVYWQYSKAKKIMTAIGVSLIIANAAIAYATGGGSLEFAFSKCPLISDHENWPDIKFSFTYRNKMGDMFKKLSKLKVEISKGKESDLKDGGSAGIGVSGSLEYDFVKGGWPIATGDFKAGLKVPLYEKGPLELWSMLTLNAIGFNTGEEYQDVISSGFKWDLGLDVGLWKTQEKKKKETLLGVGGKWTILELSTGKGFKFLPGIIG